MTRRRYSPALAHKMRVEASRPAVASGVAPAEARGAQTEPPQGEAYARLELQLRGDMQALKQIQSLERKIDYKRQVLPAYADWILGVLSAGHAPGKAPQDDVFAQLMVWTIDVGDYAAAIDMADHVLRNGLRLPERIERTPACFVVEEIAEAAIKAFTAATDDKPADFPSDVLGQLELLIETLPEDATDMPDEVRAKLERAVGLALLAEAKDEDLRARQEAALQRYLRAVELDGRVGAKKDIERLQRELKKPETPLAPETAGEQTGQSDQTSQPDQTGQGDQTENPPPPPADG